MREDNTKRRTMEIQRNENRLKSSECRMCDANASNRNR